jgi:exodeoxyribonuclease III
MSGTHPSLFATNELADDTNSSNIIDLAEQDASNTSAKKSLKIATWNVNSIHVRQQHLLQYLQEDDIDIIGIQELKGLAPKFPFQSLDDIGYAAVINDQATYNGVAFVYKKSIAPLLNIDATILNNPHFEDPQKRLISLEIKNTCTLICAYIPNGESLTSDKFIYKMQWLDALKIYLKEIQQKQPIVLLGDYNITVDDRDVYDPVGWRDGIHCSTQERTFFKYLNDSNLFDVLRAHHQETPELYTWWDYRMHSFRRNLGLRIDHIFADNCLANRIINAYINKTPRTWERPSDHTPVVFELALLS